MWSWIFGKKEKHNNEFIMIEEDTTDFILIKDTKKKTVLPSIQDNKYPISKQTRKEVFENKCYCCLRHITMDDWHCGHILARKNNGSRNVQNLKPVCKDCNLNMGSMNMNLYIISRKLPGKKNLDFNDPFISFFQKYNELVISSLKKVEILKEKLYINNKEYKKIKKMLNSTNKSLDEKLSLIININQFLYI
jgi:hypothetical protein